MKKDLFILIIGFSLMLIYFISLFRVMWYERGINKLKEEMNDKIEFEKGQPQSQTTIYGRIDRVKDIYNPQIEKLERKRRFILDKLPFIRK